jgi:CBS domain-containing protein
VNTKLVSGIDTSSRTRLAVVIAEASLLDVAKLLSDTQISLVVVCDADGTVVGVITKTDIVRQIGLCWTGTTVAAAVMTREVTTCRPTDSLSDVLSMMGQRGFVHVPVVDEQFRPCGVDYAWDALRVLLADEEYEESLLKDYVMGIGYR